MKTIVWKIDPAIEHAPQIKAAAELLKGNETVAFPTETVYGLGANATNDQAVQKIFAAKGRPSDNPLIVHIAKVQQLEDLVEEVPEHARKLMEAFWPGPLTIILKKKGRLSDSATAGLDSVGIRMPDHPIALALIAAADLPIAAPSANLSGKPSPTTAGHVANDLTGRISGIVDGGETGVGLESTVVDCTRAVPVILRPGGVTREELMAVVGEVREDVALHNPEEAPKAPGMKYTHYAPDAPFILMDGSVRFIQAAIDQSKSEGKKTGVLTTEENKDAYTADTVISCGSRKDLATVAAGIYDALRTFDESGTDVIYGEVFPYEGIGDAIMNRLMKAAGHHLMKE
ncbi:L-threonylcarbamoyladenylate synthase [Bacillus testis]|uniref:L-threonylcarbamoyladenylate synthase n=1 Tax=Bacillus testis TaxID=1622072 RepID=UPI00067ED693|nr:L-threonylcarbamoyladenylate synthase [Bacillus testis]